MTSLPLDPALERLLRDLAPVVLGAMVRRQRDFAAAEDAVQDALIAAASQWPRDGVPDNPRGWLYRVSQRRLTEHVRSEIARRNREAAVAFDTSDTVAPTADSEEPGVEADDTLVLLFMCCHPSLTPASAIALTLRAVGGLTTPEIAKAFLVPEATIGQRITRAKQTINESAIPFRMPPTDERAARLDAVLHVLYLIFNEGYTSSSGAALSRADLSNEAIRLARELVRMLPASGDATALLALMLLTDARRAARTGRNGELIPLHEQDRSLWDREQIREGAALAERALAKGAIGEYQLRRRLPPCMTKRRALRTPTGHRSWRSTRC